MIQFRFQKERTIDCLTYTGAGRKSKREKFRAYCNYNSNYKKYWNDIYNLYGVSMCVLSFHIKVHVNQNCTNRRKKESMDLMSCEGRTNRARQQLYVGCKKERKLTLLQGFFKKQAWRTIASVGVPGRRQLADLNGISEKSLMKELFTKIRAGIRGITKDSVVHQPNKRGY